MAKKKGNGITKTDAVRNALKSLGNDAKPLDIQKHVKRYHNLTLDTKLISVYKSYLAKQASGKSAVIKKPKKRGRPAGKKAAPAASAPRSTGISINDINAVKALTDRLGKKTVKELADVLGTKTATN